MKAMSPAVADGYIALADKKGIRIVADGFRFTNEIRWMRRRNISTSLKLPASAFPA